MAQLPQMNYSLVRVRFVSVKLVGVFLLRAVCTHHGEDVDENSSAARFRDFHGFNGSAFLVSDVWWVIRRIGESDILEHE